MPLDQKGSKGPHTPPTPSHKKKITRTKNEKNTDISFMKKYIQTPKKNQNEYRLIDTMNLLELKTYLLRFQFSFQKMKYDDIKNITRTEALAMITNYPAAIELFRYKPTQKLVV